MEGQTYVQAYADKSHFGDIQSASERILTDFRNGRFGRMALEAPPKLPDLREVAAAAAAAAAAPLVPDGPTLAAPSGGTALRADEGLREREDEPLPPGLDGGTIGEALDGDFEGW